MYNLHLEGKESDNRGELKEDKVCWKSSKIVEKRSEINLKSSKSVVKWSEVKWNKVKWSEVKWREVQCRERGKNDNLWENFIWVVKWWEVKGWGESVSTICVGKNTRNYVQCFLTLVLFTFVYDIFKNVLCVSL